MLTAILVIMGCTAIFLLIQPFLSAHGRWPVECLILVGWGIIGVVVWRQFAQSGHSASELELSLLLEPSKETK
jgi:hypothetical protein